MDVVATLDRDTLAPVLSRTNTLERTALALTAVLVTGCQGYPPPQPLPPKYDYRDGSPFADVRLKVRSDAPTEVRQIGPKQREPGGDFICTTPCDVVVRGVGYRDYFRVLGDFPEPEEGMGGFSIAGEGPTVPVVVETGNQVTSTAGMVGLIGGLILLHGSLGVGAGIGIRDALSDGTPAFTDTTRDVLVTTGSVGIAMLLVGLPLYFASGSEVRYEVPARSATHPVEY